MEKFNAFIEVLKSALQLAREAGLVAIFVLLILWPSFLGDRLKQAGFRDGSILGFNWSAAASQDAIAKAGEALDAARAGANTAPENSDEKRNFQAVIDKLQNSITSQSRLIEISQPEKLTSGGWVYLGSVDVKRQHWLASNPYYHTIRNEWPVKVGDLVAFSLLTNMRADSLPDQRQTAKILRDIPIGADARILELDDQRETHRNPSLKNAEAGYLIWAKVEIASK